MFFVYSFWDIQVCLGYSKLFKIIKDSFKLLNKNQKGNFTDISWFEINPEMLYNKKMLLYLNWPYLTTNKISYILCGICGFKIDRNSQKQTRTGL